MINRFAMKLQSRIAEELGAWMAAGFVIFAAVKVIAFVF
jgi:hypothetical protein